MPCQGSLSLGFTASTLRIYGIGWMSFGPKALRALRSHTTPTVPMGKCLSLKIGLAIRWTTTMAPSESATSPSLKLLKSKAPQRRTRCFQPGTNLRALKSCPIALRRTRSVRSTGLTPGKRSSVASVSSMTALPIPTSLVSLVRAIPIRQRRRSRKTISFPN